MGKAIKRQSSTVGLDRTYEELKPHFKHRIIAVFPSLDRTYEELKLFINANAFLRHFAFGSYL